MMDEQALRARRLERWGQTPGTRIGGPEGAVALIERVGVATLFPASAEVPNLYHAYMGDPEARTDSGHDSPSGEVYGWRWALGRREAAFYTAIVRNRPTWVGWALLPAVLRLRGELRGAPELHEAGELSGNALRVAQALEAAGGVLSTGELRREAGFPTGKDQRAAYLKAVEELDTRLLLAKVFAAGAAAAERLTREEALARVLAVYLPPAVYAVPAVLAKDLRLPEAELRAGLGRLVEAGRAVEVELSGQKGTCYVWAEK